uniref:MEG 2.3 isoform 4 n=1 Tax=Schistosoma mansoni TaxID=6183 RepID=D7PD71_SCHMA|nr:MEG 2.3 isoform 4 [Schistosoma mansoni]
MCLTIFYVIHLLAIFSDGAEWVITCNKTTCCDEDGNSKICCVGNDCKDVIKPRSMFTTLFRNYLKEELV